jgi:2-polyprenyl-6-hydroxyphenyl methylase/3-demethylubiquinone-9 3-methyltransferase
MKEISLQIFDFGLNWEAFSKTQVDSHRLAIASSSLKTLLQREKMDGLSFLDIGCGSGLFSIAAENLNARKVLGIDINPVCIEVSEKNRDMLARGSKIIFLRGSVLDNSWMTSLGLFDIVYAWGSLHHTGALWEAIQIASQNVSDRGLFVIAIYNKHVTSPLWQKIKWTYNHLPKIFQKVAIFIFGGVILFAKFLVTKRNPLEKERGMDFWFDVVDWVGGYPYEYAKPMEVQNFVEKLGFRLVKYVPAYVPTGCNEFVFERI